jgi:hypothetical protein
MQTEKGLKYQYTRHQMLLHTYIHEYVPSIVACTTFSSITLQCYCCMYHLFSLSHDVLSYVWLLWEHSLSLGYLLYTCISLLCIYIHTSYAWMYVHTSYACMYVQTSYACIYVCMFKLHMYVHMYVCSNFICMSTNMCFAVVPNCAGSSDTVS